MFQPGKSWNDETTPPTARTQPTKWPWEREQRMEWEYLPWILRILGFQIAPQLGSGNTSPLLLPEYHRVFAFANERSER